MFMRLLVLNLLFVCCSGAAAATPTVDIELILEKGSDLEAPQKWIAMLKDMGFTNVRIRSGQRGDVGEIKKLGSDARPHYSVTGIVTSSNVLRLPGGNIRLGDKTALRNWVAKLQDGGEEGVVAKKVMYGLTAKQMLEVHDSLKGAVDFETKGKKSGEVVSKIVDRLSLDVTLDRSASSADSSEELVADEFKGLAYGASLAAVLRPLGYVFVPEKKLGEKLHLRITDAKSVQKPWPIGWDSPDAAGRLAPDYFKQTNAEITDYVLSDALTAIQKRIGLPLVFDYNNIVRHRVDMSKRVSTKKGKKSYASVVDDILYQAGLAAEMRIDEAEQPFLWITTTKR